MTEMAADTAEPTMKARMANWRAGAPDRPAQPQGGGAVYGLGMIGALVYFVGGSKGARGYALAVGKAVVWPAIMVYRAFRYLDR
jgi:hypothetical protein